MARVSKSTKMMVMQRCQGFCEAGVSEYCTKVGTDAHHLKSRARGGTNDPANLVWVCRFCHDFIHQHPAEATASGLMRSSWS